MNKRKKKTAVKGKKRPGQFRFARGKPSLSRQSKARPKKAGKKRKLPLLSTLFTLAVLLGGVRYAYYALVEEPRVEKQKIEIAYEGLLAATDQLLDPFLPLYQFAQKNRLIKTAREKAGKVPEAGSPVMYKGFNLEDEGFIKGLCEMNIKKDSGDRSISRVFAQTQRALRSGLEKLTALPKEYPGRISPEDAELISQISRNKFIQEVTYEESGSGGSKTQTNGVEFFPDYCWDHSKSEGDLKDYKDFVDLALILEFRILKFRTGNPASSTQP